MIDKGIKKQAKKMTLNKEIEIKKQQIGWEKMPMWLKGGILGIIIGGIIVILMEFEWVILLFGLGALIGWIIYLLEEKDKRNKGLKRQK
jgi:uncharacterized membrane protein YfcA